MTSGAPWSVKGIDPKAREIAKGLARRSGMTLGEWLNQVILEDNGLSEDPAPTDYSSDRYGADRRPPVYAGGDGHRRFEAPGHMGDEVMRVGEALDRLSARIEAAEFRSTQAINSVDQSVTGLVSRLGVAEREQTAVAARFEGAVDDLRTDQARVTERMRKVELEAAGSRSAEGIKAMEGALAKVASHLYDGEDRTRETLASLRQDIDGLAGRVEAGIAGSSASDLVEAVVARLTERLEQAEGRTTSALRSLETSFASLDQRLIATEQRVDDGRENDFGLRQLASNLSERVDAVRTEMAEKIRDTADGRFDRMERTLEAMNSHVQNAERRSAQAIERMGHEVLRMADVLGRKVEGVESRSADAIEQVSGEVKRMATVMETRLAQADNFGAQALEKLGGEIARITERLAERIGDAERRSAQAMDDVGDQLARVTDRLQDRQDRVTTELGERIRQSEERTARLLEDARARIDDRLAETNRRLEAKAAEPVYTPPTYAGPPAFAGGAYAGPAYAAPAYAPTFAGPPLGEPIYLDPDVAPFGHDSFAESRAPGLNARAPVFAEPHSGPVEDFADEDFIVEDEDSQDLAPPLAAEAAEPDVRPFGQADFGEPDFNEPSLTGHAASSQYDEPAEVPLDALASPAAVIASSAGTAAAEQANTLSQAWPRTDKTPASEALPGATFVSQPFAIHGADGPSQFSATETYVTAPARTAVFDVADLDDADLDDDLEAPEAVDDQPAPYAAPRFPNASSTAAASDDVDLEAEALFAPRASTRDLIEQARAATRAATRPENRGRARLRGPAPTSDLFGAASPAARVAPRRRQASVWTNALLITGAAAAMGVSVAGYALLSQKPSGALPQRVADALGMKSPAAVKPSGAEIGGPILAEALTTKPITDPQAAPAAPTLAAPAAPNADAISLYGDATRRIESRDFTGVEALKKSANLGYAPAQFYLAKLYEGGEAGLHKDSAEARRWTERAANGGDKKAMHNLALYYFEGTGGPKNTTTAAQWFRRAADLGLTDSQYNLGRLFEEGFGVAQNPAEAYKWYVIAARSGDAESRASAQRVKGQLSVEAQAAAERAAMTFLAQGPAAPVQIAQASGPTASPVAIAQRALSHLGYYQGPADGAPSPALKMAIAAYQRDQGLPASGVLDPALNDRLSVIAQ